MRICTLLSLLCLIFASCSKDKEKAVEVTTITVEPHDLPITLQFVGVAQSSHPVEIWSRVEGYLKNIDFVEGSFVNEGDLLFELDPSQFEAAIKEAQANLDREKANLSSAQKAVDRYKPLYEQKAASRKDLDDATAQLLAEQAAVAMYSAKLDEALLNLSYTRITSPISGYTSNAKYREGTLITPSTNGLLTTVAVLDPIWINLNISDYYFLVSSQEVARKELTVPPNNNYDVTLTLADGSNYPYHGVVSFVSPLLDPNTGTLNVRAVFPNPNLLLKPGQFVRAAATGAVRPNAIVVPQRAIQQGEKGRYVYVVKHHRAQMQPIETGNWDNGNWVVLSGLSKGDVVIVDGVNKVKTGTKVKIIKDDP